MQDILKKVQVNMPFQMLVEQYLPVIIREKINPEIGFDCFALDQFSRDEYQRVADILLDAGLSITFHAPFYDLRPGALDWKIRQATADRLSQIFELVPLFRPRTIVCHASFDHKYYVTHEEVWLENSLKMWQQFAAMASEMSTTIALENVYEADPHMLHRLFSSFAPSEAVCFCFDTGHFNAFATTTLDEWMSALGVRIGEIHLHDNNGSGDEHAPVGEGNFPFYQLFDYLHKEKIQPIITCEPHTEENLWRTLKNIEKMGLLEHGR